MLFKFSHVYIVGVVFLCLTSSCLAFENQLTLSKKTLVFGARLKGEVDVRKDNGVLLRKHADIGLRLHTSIKGLTLGAHYRRIYTLAVDSWKLENRPYIQLEQKIKGNNKLDWKFRIRQEFREREGREHSKRSRVRAKVFLPYGAFNAKPYASHEYYYDLTAHQLSQARLDLGLSFHQFKAVVPTLSFKITAKQKEKWQTSSTLVLSVAF